mgnify:CR=1 FL=1
MSGVAAVQQRGAVHADRQQHRSEPQWELQEPLPAGTYTGVSTAFPQNALTVENKGGFNGARAPNCFMITTRMAYRLEAGPATAPLQAHFDIFNLTNHANFNTPSSDRRDAATFLVVASDSERRADPDRTVQFDMPVLQQAT